jgi:hypothetical protein
MAIFMIQVNNNIHLDTICMILVNNNIHLNTETMKNISNPTGSIEVIKAIWQSIINPYLKKKDEPSNNENNSHIYAGNSRLKV